MYCVYVLCVCFYMGVHEGMFEHGRVCVYIYVCVWEIGDSEGTREGEGCGP